jgi:peptidoglycan/xylan/chitin deacetylase (PgdA/CDA1 family)
MSGQIFISYRREESRWSARSLYDRLSARFDRKQIFMDIDAIALGDDFVKVIEKTVGECDVLIAVIGAHWLTSTDEQDGRRLDDPEDFVRMEIATALKRDIRVIPVLVDGALMPRSTELPDDLKPLVRRNALQISDTGFDDDCRRLMAAIEQVLEKTTAQRRQGEEKERLEAERRQKEEQDRLETERRETEAKERLDAECREREEKERFAAKQREEKERLEVPIAEEMAGHSASPSDTIPPPNPTAHDAASRETAHETKPQPAAANDPLDTTTPSTGKLRSDVQRQVPAPSDDSSRVDDPRLGNPGVESPTWAMAASQKRSATKSRILLFVAIFAVAIGGLIFLIVRSNTGSRPPANGSATVSPTPPNPTSYQPANADNAAAKHSPSPVSAATSTPAPVMVDRNAKVTVLAYHRFEDNPRDLLAISPAEFKSQMQALKDNGIAVISMKDFLAWRRGEKSIPPKSAVVTIDDGYVSGYSVAWPIMKEFGYPFTMFIYTNYVEVGGKSITWAQLEQMRDAGVDIESHTVSHHDLRRAPMGQDYNAWLHNEIYTSKDILEQKLGIKIVALALPYGTYNEVVRKTAGEAGYQALFTTYGQHISFDSAADQLGRYAIESVHPDVFKMALDFGPENDSSPGSRGRTP